MQKPDYRKPRPYCGKYAARKSSPAARTVCMALACVMVLSLLAGGIAYQSARAEEAASGQCGPNLWWRFDPSTGIITIEGTGEMDDYEHPENAPWAAFSGSIRKIVFQSGVTAIGRNAFAGCAVEEVEFPDTLTAIKQNAFQDCEKLTEIDLSATALTTIEECAFSGCPTLNEDNVNLPEGVEFVADTAFDDESEEEAAAPTEEPTIPTEQPTQPTAPTEGPTTPTEPEEPGKRTERFYSEKDYAQVTLTWENGVLVEKVMEYPYLNRVVTYRDFASETCPQTIVTTTNGKADTTVKREYDELGRLVNEETRDTRTGTFVESFAVSYISETEGVCTAHSYLLSGAEWNGNVTLYGNGAIKTVDYEFSPMLYLNPDRAVTGRLEHMRMEYDEDGFVKCGTDFIGDDNIDGWSYQEFNYLRNGALSGATAYECHHPDVVFATRECEITEEGIPVKQVYETANKDGDTGYHFKLETDFDEIGRVTMSSNSVEARGHKNPRYYQLYNEGKVVEYGYYDLEGNQHVERSYSYSFDEATGCETVVKEPGFFYGGEAIKTITVNYGTEVVDQRSIYVDAEGVIRYEVYDVNMGGYPYAGVVETGTVAPDGTYIPDEPEETMETAEESAETTEPTEETTEPTEETTEPTEETTETTEETTEPTEETTEPTEDTTETTEETTEPTEETTEATEETTEETTEPTEETIETTGETAESTEEAA